jgi:flagellar motor switch protein FliG
VALNGMRKAAMLLMSLDPGTAAELLKSAGPEVITRIAAEVAYLQATGHEKTPAPADPVKEFFELLNKGRAEGPGGDFVRRLLERAIGEQQSQEAMSRVEDELRVRAPFLPIRSAGAAELAGALADESPQAAAIVLSELPAQKSAELLALLSEEVRVPAVCAMAAAESASAEARLRVARVVGEKLEALSRGPAGGADEGRREQKLRKVAVLLRGLEPELRDALLKSISEKDDEAGSSVQALMILWEDIAAVADRSLQEALRGVEARKLALALAEADEATAAKIRGNISERLRATLAEEQSLLGTPKADEVRQAREDILQMLREMNSAGELDFERG